MTLHADTSGAGPDVVLVHGWGWHGGVWDEVVRGLARTHRVWVPDLPGHGHSRGVPAPSELEPMLNALSHCVPPGATWIGWSLGGSMALAAALRGLAERLVLVATTPRFVRHDAWECAWPREAFEHFCGEVDVDPKPALERFASLHLGEARRDLALLRRLRAELFCRGVPSKAGLRAGLELLRGTDLRSRLGQIDVPALVLHGDADQVVPQAAGEYLAQALPQGRFESLPGAGHGLPLSDADLISRAIRNFLP